MSLAIQQRTVTAILLADGWHNIIPRSFQLDAYEYLDSDYLTHGGGQAGICSTGFTAIEQGLGTPTTYLAGPLTSILAVRHTQ